MKLLGTLMVLALVAAGLWFGVGVRWQVPQPSSSQPSSLQPSASQTEPAQSSALLASVQHDNVPVVAATSSGGDGARTDMPPLAPAAEPEPVAAAQPLATPEPTVDTEPLPQAPVSEAKPVADAVAVVETAPQPREVAETVFVFWKPFYSRSAARGFAANLHARSNVAVNVVEEPRIGGLQYRVALPFASEDERLANIKKLEAATRLRIE